MSRDPGGMGDRSWLSGQRVLVLSPHADDETFGCAGTIARVKQLGGEVYCRVATFGGIDQYTREAGAPTGTPAGMTYVSGAERRAEFAAVMTLLGVDGWDALLPDTAHMHLDALPTKDLVGVLERGGDLALNALKPSLVLMPSRTFNQDHDALFRACLAATRPYPAATTRYIVPNVLLYDNGSANWSDRADWFQPSVYVDISDVLDLKVAALGLYRSQVGPQDPGADGCIALARVYGSRIGRPAAEAFQPLRLTV